MRLAGTWIRYSNSAMPHEISAAIHHGRSLRFFRCAYQAKVMKTFDTASSSAVCRGRPACRSWQRVSSWMRWSAAGVQQCGDGAATRNDQVGRDLGQRHEHEGAFSACADAAGSSCGSSCTRSPYSSRSRSSVRGAFLIAAVAAETRFDVEQRVEQVRAGRQCGFQRDDRVDEVGLVALRPTGAVR